MDDACAGQLDDNLQGVTEPHQDQELSAGGTNGASQRATVKAAEPAPAATLASKVPAVDQQHGVQTAASATGEIASAAAEAVNIERPSNEAKPDAEIVAAQDAVKSVGPHAAQSEGPTPAADGLAAESEIAQAAGVTSASGAADEANTGFGELAVEETAGACHFCHSSRTASRGSRWLSVLMLPCTVLG